MKLASLRLHTRDVPALTRFYERISGVSAWHHPKFPSTYAELRFPSFTIAIAIAQEERTGSNPSAVIEFEVDDVDAERARLAAVVTDWVMEPTDMPWGNRSMLFKDPDGTVVNFYRPIG